MIRRGRGAGAGSAGRAGILMIVAAVTALVAPLALAGGAAPGGGWTLALRGGGEQNSSAVGIDFRYDAASPSLNFHFFGRYESLESGRGLGLIDDQVYGGGLAVSRNSAENTNWFLGASLLSEGGETFSQAYIGGRFRISPHALISSSYGHGFGDRKLLMTNGPVVYEGQAVDWWRLGATWVSENGHDGEFGYRLSNPGGAKIHGVTGGYSLPLRDNWRVGVQGDIDLTEKAGIDRNWTAFLYVAFQPGASRARALDLALDGSDVVSYPVVIRTARITGPLLLITPATTSVVGYTGDTVVFTASGGTPPYTWSQTGYGGRLTVLSPTQAEWDENYDYCDVTGTATVTVTDSAGNSATAVISIPTEDC